MAEAERSKEAAMSGVPPGLAGLEGLAESRDLSVHARKLEDAGYLLCEKGYEGRVPRTEYRLTPDGRAALEDYLEHMEALIRAVRE